MITIFNRREVCITRDSQVLNRACDQLVLGGIQYRTYTNAPGNSRRGHEIAHLNVSAAYEYRVYVNKRDYEQAKHLISRG